MMNPMTPSSGSARSSNYDSSADASPLLPSATPFSVLLTEEETEEEAQVPPFSWKTVWTPLKQWCKQLRFLICIAIANAVAVMCAVALQSNALHQNQFDFRNYHFLPDNTNKTDGGSSGDDWFDSPSEKEKVLQQNKLVDEEARFLLSAALVLWVIIYGGNSYLSWKGARKIEQAAAAAAAGDPSPSDSRDPHEQEQKQEQADHQGMERPSGRVPTTDPELANDTRLEEGQEQKNIDFVKLSRSVDATFGCVNGNCNVNNRSTSSSNNLSSTPNTTFLVSFLYALFAMSFCRALVNGAYLIQVQLFAPGNKMFYTAMCTISGPFIQDFHYQFEKDEQQFGIFALLQQSSNFDTLPIDVQEWIKTQRQKSRRDRWGDLPLGNFNRSLPYIHINSGPTTMMVFPFSKQEVTTKKGPAFYPRYKNALAVYYPANDSMTEYVPSTTKEDYMYLSEFIDPSKRAALVGFPSNDAPYTNGWCASFQLDLQTILQDEAVCYSSRTNQLIHFPSVKDENVEPSRGYRGFRGFGTEHYGLYATDDTLWVASQKDFRRFLRRPMRGGLYDHSDYERDIYVSLVSLNVVTLTRTLAAEQNITVKVNNDNDDLYSQAEMTVNPRCRQQYHIELGASLLALALVAVYLYRMDVPSCVLPLCVGISLVVHSLVPTTWAALFLIFCSCICLHMLVAQQRHPRSTMVVWKCVSVEMLIWALYSFLLSSCWGLWIMVRDMALWNNLFYVIGRHPGNLLLVPTVAFVESVAISVLLNHPILQVLASFYGLLGVLSCLLIFFGLHYLLISAVLLTLSLGCFRAGGLLQAYRIHVLVYARRLGRCFMAKCRTGERRTSTNIQF